MVDTPTPDVPADLQKSKEAKVLAEQKAADQLKNQVNRGESFLVSIGYISFLCILPLVLLRDSQFAQFHGKQALVLAIFIYFFDFIEIFPPTIAIIYTALKICVVIYSIIMSFNGKYFKIPFIYNLSEKFTIDIKPEPQKA